MERIGIFFGGSSSEREVSLEGGRNVYQKLDSAQYERLPIFVDARLRCWLISEALLLQNTTSDVERLCEKRGTLMELDELPARIDFAFVIGHGKFMEDGCLQGVLEILNIPYNGPGVLGAALGSDKWVQRQLLRASEIAVPITVAVLEQEWRQDPQEVKERIAKGLSLPLVVKPSREGCSTAIGMITSWDRIDGAMDEAFKWDRRILIEEKIQGMEVTVSVLGNRQQREALPVTETPWGENKGYLTLQDKFLPGGAEMITPARLSPDVTARVQETAVKVCEVLGLVGYPRIDLFVTHEGTPIVLEANTLPGITPSTMVFHQAAEVGMTSTQFLDRIIQLGRAAHAKKRGPL
jgi:D-alanine-D-alanine ligase